MHVNIPQAVIIKLCFQSIQSYRAKFSFADISWEVERQRKEKETGESRKKGGGREEAPDLLLLPLLSLVIPPAHGIKSDLLRASP